MGEKQVDELDKATENQVESSDSPQVKATAFVKAYVPSIPFPQRLQKHKLNKQFQKFLDVFKKLHINIPFATTLAQMPNYAKLMKDILSNKMKLEDNETVVLTEECSVILQHKLPSKLKDPGSFTIPCNIGNSYIDKALCDLGLADRSIKHPRGICEDILVKVDKFIFPTDFIISDMEEDRGVLLILGRPFFATRRALIDVQRGLLLLRLNPTMQEVVRKEVLKLLDAWIIYPISDRHWASPVQMLERLTEHAYYCFLDGYSGYNQIPIAPDDQEKMTFTCPYDIFANRRMLFGLCNAPATFQRLALKGVLSPSLICL
ncbi:uncharacterized protein LOC111404799 [Olea europaea var. sylvestris]|uniref:uncharacterized protein LOC111404799 n=1 Tax=Olea europaea var. sylvestris TaxID=158386 RepID=UPI000C1D5397|nr:uncharacterized protein LOC111404799 [Olea europaea var. sylvestris]